MIDFLKSNAGIFTTATIGLVFQLVGVALVVWDLMKRHGVARRFTSQVGMLERVHRELEVNALAMATEMAHGDGTVGADQRLALEAKMVAEKAVQTNRGIVGYLMSEVQVPSHWKTWVGPVTLLLGILLAYAASMFSVR
ncbi:hypothetical protein [Nocardia nova]|uniref:hypothetical protein n=1 Tax=Nocardia nova TaxID=37330 RepID=UPI00273828A0|nr:hypothetical protein [Nocardia nova]